MLNKKMSNVFSLNSTVRPIYPFGLLVEPTTPNANINILDISELQKLVRREHLVVLRGFSTLSAATEFVDYCERWGEISIWPFGKVLDLVEHDNPADHIFDHTYMPLHWDGMYRPQVPELQIFHCVIAPLVGQGGRTTFSNTVLALQYAPKELKNQWGKVTGIYERKMEFYNSKTIAPIIDKHPYAEQCVIRYNEPPIMNKGRFVNPPSLEFTGLSLDELADFHHHLTKALHDSRNFYAHEWQAGDIVIADNFSLLHGREAFVSRSPRHLQRVHVLSDPPFENSGLVSYQY